MFKKFILKYYQKLRISLFSYLSTALTIKGNPVIFQATEFHGKGKLIFGNKVQFGFYPSPYYYEGVTYLEARSETALIEFGNDVFCNNNLKIICDKSTIKIGNNVVIGTNVEIIDSDFHELDAEKRHTGNHISIPVTIEDNVIINSNVKILKGVTIGKNSVVANSAVVTKSFPCNVIIGGFPAKVIAQLESYEA